MTTQRSDDSDGAASMSSHAWATHMVGALVDPVAHRQLVDALLRRPFAAARRHECAGPPQDDEDAERAPGQRTTTAARRTRKAAP